MKAEGTWVLAEGFNTFLSNVFHRQDWPSDGRVAMLRLLSYGAKEDDIVLILHMDRKDHSLMNYAQQFDRLPIKEQENLALLVGQQFSLLVTCLVRPWPELRRIKTKHSFHSFPGKTKRFVIFSFVIYSRRDQPVSG